mgnify:CR=1 FL=1
MTDYLNNPFPPGKSSIGELTFKLWNVSLSNIIRFDFNTTTLTNETNLDNNNVTLLAKVLLKTDLRLASSHEPEQVSIGGDQTVGLSSIKNLDEFGMEVIHIYQVGRSSISCVVSKKTNNDWIDFRLSMTVRIMFVHITSRYSGRMKLVMMKEIMERFYCILLKIQLLKLRQHYRIRV